MPYEISWYHEKRVIGVRFYGDLSEKAPVNFGNSIEPFVEAGDLPLVLFLDLREVTKYPFNFEQLLDGMNDYRFNSQIAWTIMLSDNSLINFFGAMASKATGVPMRTFATLEEADSFVADVVPHLEAMLRTRETA